MRSRELIITARRQAGLSLRALARATGVDPGAVSRYENGLKVPRSDTLEHLLLATGHELDVRPRRARSARLVDALCAAQADAILANPGLVADAQGEMYRLKGRSSSYETWSGLLRVGPLACVAALTSTSEAVRQLKADSPFAYVVVVSDEHRQQLVERSRAA